MMLRQLSLLCTPLVILTACEFQPTSTSTSLEEVASELGFAELDHNSELPAYIFIQVQEDGSLAFGSKSIDEQYAKKLRSELQEISPVHQVVVQCIGECEAIAFRRALEQTKLYFDCGETVECRWVSETTGE